MRLFNRGIGHGAGNDDAANSIPKIASTRLLSPQRRLIDKPVDGRNTL
jgi:hypothetical protein